MQANGKVKKYQKKVIIKIIIEKKILAIKRL